METEKWPKAADSLLITYKLNLKNDFLNEY